MFCSECGFENEDNAKFCRKCGNPLSSNNDETLEYSKKDANNKSNKRNIGLICLSIIIIVAAICALFITAKDDSSLTITNEEFTEDNPLTIKLTDSKGNPIPSKTVNINFSNNGNINYNYDDTTNENGIMTLNQKVNVGTYNVTCNFEGDDKYNPASTTKIVTIKKSEPDYESYDFYPTFRDTDVDGDGYVMLSDMNIAHTPEDIQMRMFSDSDDDGDGKLNEHEYYKFMYKLNYDSHSYGL